MSVKHTGGVGQWCTGQSNALTVCSPANARLTGNRKADKTWLVIYHIKIHAYDVQPRESRRIVGSHQTTGLAGAIKQGEHVKLVVLCLDWGTKSHERWGRPSQKRRLGSSNGAGYKLPSKVADTLAAFSESEVGVQ